MAGHRPLPEPVLVGGRPRAGELDEPPAHLSKVAREFWSEAVHRLVECGIVDRVDTAALEQLCIQYARMRTAQAVIKKVGTFSVGSRGQLRTHPAVAQERDATLLYLRLAQEFGLTPLARGRLGLTALRGRSLQAEIADHLGPVELTVIDGDVEDDVS
jgi:P27 family predicted phage terminase small subunit